MKIIKIHTILYVKNQALSRAFYESLLKRSPVLDVPGMTEFQLSESHILGLMPEAGIKKLLGNRLPDPAAGSGIPRAELYICSQDAELLMTRALSRGAVLMSEFQVRDWSDFVGYVLDPDGHVLAFAKPSEVGPSSNTHFQA